MRLTTFAAIATLTVSLSACGPDEPELPCQTPAEDVPSRIADGANDIPITPTGKIGVVKAPDRRSVYIVAMEFSAESLDDPEIGYWFIPDLDGGSPILALDENAHQFTDWPHQMDGETFDVTEPGVEDAKACLK